MPAVPQIWTHDELVRDIHIGVERFRESRLGEPQQKWLDEYDQRRADFDRLISHYGVKHPNRMSPADVAHIFRDRLGDSFRYVLGPPISENDLKKIADVESLAPGKLAREEGDQQSLLDLLKFGLDPKRFPWVAEDREPTDIELANALNISAALHAAQRVQTHRRTTGKDEQEETIKQFLRDIGFVDAPTTQIENISQGPRLGTFCGETLVGTRKADVTVRLFDGRLMPIECKVSNSELNSIKRINNDAAVKAHSWISDFGPVNIVPAAALSGVFGVSSLEYAQKRGLALFWSHDLDAMRKFIESTR